MALTRQQLEVIAAWVDTYAARTQKLSTRASAAVAAVYSGVNYYDRAAAARAAEDAANISDAATLIAAGLATQYVASVVGEAIGSAAAVPASLATPPLRNGTPATEVFSRPMKLFRRKVAEGADPAVAFEQASRLARTLTDGNIRLAERDAANSAVSYLAPRAGVTGYRRVVRPELSRTGTCGLCIAASDQVYNVDRLMPLHDDCKCTVMPIFGSDDPGSSLNNLALGDLYTRASRREGAAASGTAGEDLKATRWAVSEHGEWGPYLHHDAHQFTGPDDLTPAASTAA